MDTAFSFEEKINNIISPSLESLGFEVVRIVMIGGDKLNILQIMLDRIDGKNISVDDCHSASKQISAVLDVEDPIKEKYNLEVSSPGIDRPLTRLKDFEKYSGHEAKIEVFEKINDSRKFRGTLLGVDKDQVVIDDNIVPIKTEEKANRVVVDFKNIKSAKLILTDELLALHKKNNK